MAWHDAGTSIAEYRYWPGPRENLESQPSVSFFPRNSVAYLVTFEMQGSPVFATSMNYHFVCKQEAYIHWHGMGRFRGTGTTHDKNLRSRRMVSIPGSAIDPDARRLAASTYLIRVVCGGCEKDWNGCVETAGFFPRVVPPGEPFAEWPRLKTLSPVFLRNLACCVRTEN